ncbi:MAG: hypothetical protein ACXABY_32025 [Candidatus Thorarchaeota archaeon]
MTLLMPLIIASLGVALVYSLEKNLANIILIYVVVALALAVGNFVLRFLDEF